MSANRQRFLTGHDAHRHATDRRRAPWASIRAAESYAEAAVRARALDHQLFDAFDAADLHALRWHEIATAVTAIAGARQFQATA